MGPRPAFSTTGVMLTESLDSGLRRLLPKPLASQNSFPSLPPPPPILRNQERAETDDVDFAVNSAGPVGPAQGGAGRRRQTSTAGKVRGRRDQEYKSTGAEANILPNPKIPIKRGQKPEKRQTRGLKIAVACQNCR